MKTQKVKPVSRKPAVKSRTAVRGKYFNQLGQGTNLAIIDPALHPYFPDSESVNQALRAFLDIQKRLNAASPAVSVRAA